MDDADPSTTSGILATSKDEAPRDRDPHISSGRLEVRCPNCHTPMEVAVDTLLTDLTCSVCGSHFSLVDQSQATRMAPPLSTIARFELIERLGVGGFGSVWKARDRELDRTVAIKIPRQGGMTAEEQEKFFREARAAAQLRHPNIVSVHEVGRDGENVYIVSDFVRGVTLGDWLTGQKLTSREAAELCAKIADALHHAHEQGVVHRDLKPANIMIDGAGEPHLMDFGLARRDAGEVTVTVEGEVLGTPAYMSPEQALGESHAADRRSDVYSLGVILFQLLTGELPFRGNARMIMHQVIHDEPPSPRKLNANVSVDLETITLKCLEKEPTRRYSTAQDLAEDLGRFLAGDAIRARPISRSERAVRWVQRNPAVSALTAAVLLALVAGTVVSAYFARDALRKAALAMARESEATIARRDAEQRQKEAEQARTDEAQARQEAEAVTSFLVQAFRSPDPAKDSRTITVAELLDRAEKDIEQQLSDRPLTQAVLLEAIGLSRLQLGISEDAIAPLTKATQLREKHLGASHPKTLSAKHLLATAYRFVGRNDEAIALHEELLKARRETLGSDHNETRASLYSLGFAYGRAGRTDEALRILEEALVDMRAKFGADDPAVFLLMSMLADAYKGVGRVEEAMPLAEQALAGLRKVRGPGHADTLFAMNYLARVYRRVGRRDEAIRLQEESLAGMREKFGPDDEDTVALMDELAFNYRDAGRIDEALPLAEELLARRREKPGHHHPATLRTMNDLAVVYDMAGLMDKGLALQEEALVSMREHLGPTHTTTIIALHNLGGFYRSASRLEEAVPLFEEALPRFREQFGPDHADTLICMNQLAWILATAPNDELRDGKRALELATEACEATDFNDPTQLHTLAAAYAETSDFASAIKWAEKALELLGDGGSAEFRQALSQALADYRAGKPRRHSGMP